MKAVPARAALALLAALVAAACSNNNAGPGPSGVPGPPAGSNDNGRVVTLLDVTDSIDVTSGGTGTWNYAGQSVTMPGSGTYSSIRFNFYTFHKTPTAFGTMFILDREYLGLPGDLSAATPGFIAKTDAAIEGNPGPLDDVKGEYVFPSNVSLKGGTKYWFYTNKMGSFAGSFDTDIYSGGDKYLTGHPTQPFRKSHASGRMVGGTYLPPPDVYTDANFKLQGVVR